MARQCCSGGSKCSTPEASTQQQLEPAACGYLQRLWMLCRLYKRGSQSLLYSASSQSEEDAFLLALFRPPHLPKREDAAPAPLLHRLCRPAAGRQQRLGCQLAPGECSR